jgi:Tfp pilus assembly protein PilF
LGLVSNVTDKSGESQTNTLRQVCYQQLGAIYLHNKKYEKAASHFTKAVKLAEADRLVHKGPPYPPTVPGMTLCSAAVSDATQH